MSKVFDAVSECLLGALLPNEISRIYAQFPAPHTHVHTLVQYAQTNVCDYCVCVCLDEFGCYLLLKFHYFV